MRKSTMFVLMLVFCFLFVSVISGCSSNGGNAGSEATAKTEADSTNKEEPAATAAALDPVELKFVFIGPGEQKDMKVVEDEVNKILKEKINATVKLQLIDFGSYGDRLNTMTAAGEELDVVWTSNWSFPFKENVMRGAFLPLDDLMEPYATDLMKALPGHIFDAARVDGKLYAIPNYQLNFQREGIGMREELANKYSIDLGSVKAFKDLEPILETLKQNEPDIIPYALDNRGIFGEMQKSIGLRQILTGAVQVAGVKWDDPELKVIHLFETEAYKDYLQTVRSWYQKGYINQDASIQTDLQAMEQAGLIGIGWGSGVSETRLLNGTVGKDGAKSVWAKTAEAITDASGYAATMLAISKNSKHPERALMFINLLNTDKELYNLISWGIEGKHYTLDDQGRMVIDPNGGYNPDIKWVLGNTFNSLLKESESVEAAKADQAMNDSAEVMPLSGFAFDSTNVTTEIANLKTVIDEYEVPLRTGSVDVEKYYPILLEKLEQAGIDKLIVELQRQVDAWKAAK
jgi:putative aldouronate transport system substrate-binding protein